MKLNLITTLICASFCNQMFANPIDAPVSTAKSNTALSGMSVFLYLLPVLDDTALSSITSSGQMTVTPTSTINNVVFIKVLRYTSSDGTCTDYQGQNALIGNAGSSVTLNVKPYLTTNPSNYALFTQAFGLGEGDVIPDLEYVLTDIDFVPLSTTSQCISGGGTCNSDTNCGWDANIFWTPSPVA